MSHDDDLKFKRRKHAHSLVVTARAQSARMSSVCLYVCPSFCDVQIPWSHRLEYFKNNFMADQLKVCAQDDSNT